jgi:hypothetical protein
MILNNIYKFRISEEQMVVMYINVGIIIKSDILLIITILIYFNDIYIYVTGNMDNPVNAINHLAIYIIRALPRYYV